MSNCDAMDGLFAKVTTVCLGRGASLLGEPGEPWGEVPASSGRGASLLGEEVPASSSLPPASSERWAKDRAPTESGVELRLPVVVGGVGSFAECQLVNKSGNSRDLISTR